MFGHSPCLDQLTTADARASLRDRLDKAYKSNFKVFKVIETHHPNLRSSKFDVYPKSTESTESTPKRT